MYMEKMATYGNKNQTTHLRLTKIGGMEPNIWMTAKLLSNSTNGS